MPAHIGGKLFFANSHVTQYRIFSFSTKESATHAIVAVHNTDINGQVVKCSWGKESGDPNNAPVAGQVRYRCFQIMTVKMFLSCMEICRFEFCFILKLSDNYWELFRSLCLEVNWYTKMSLKILLYATATLPNFGRVLL